MKIKLLAFMLLTASITLIDAKQFNTGVLKLADGTFLKFLGDDNTAIVLKSNNQQDITAASCDENDQCSIPETVKVNIILWALQPLYDSGPLQLSGSALYYRFLVTKNKLYRIEAGNKQDANKNASEYMNAANNNQNKLGNANIEMWQR